MKPIISVIMPTYNGEKYIVEAIQSVLNQNYSDFEFIIIDDGSTDNTEEIIKTYSDTRIKYVKKEKNSGIADSLNLGISLAKGKYIARMDDDDISYPNRFEEQLNVLEKNEAIIVCGSNVMLNDGIRVAKKPQFHKDILMNLLFSNAIVHPSVMIRKSVFESIKYNTNFVPSEDYDLWSRLIWIGEFYNIQKSLLHYRDHSKSETSTRRKEQLLKNVAITTIMLDKLCFKNLPHNKENIKAFASHDYSISGKEFRNMLNWFEVLKIENTEEGKFDPIKFDEMVSMNIERFLISYFKSQTIINKIVPFIYLKLNYKYFIFKEYLKKIK